MAAKKLSETLRGLVCDDVHDLCFWICAAQLGEKDVAVDIVAETPAPQAPENAYTAHRVRWHGCLVVVLWLDTRSTVWPFCRCVAHYRRPETKSLRSCLITVAAVGNRRPRSSGPALWARRPGPLPGLLPELVKQDLRRTADIFLRR